MAIAWMHGCISRETLHVSSMLRLSWWDRWLPMIFLGQKLVPEGRNKKKKMTGRWNEQKAFWSSCQLLGNLKLCINKTLSSMAVMTLHFWYFSFEAKWRKPVQNIWTHYISVDLLQIYFANFDLFGKFLGLFPYFPTYLSFLVYVKYGHLNLHFCIHMQFFIVFTFNISGFAAFCIFRLHIFSILWWQVTETVCKNWTKRGRAI